MGFYRCSSSQRLFSVLFTGFLSFQKAAFPVEEKEAQQEGGLVTFWRGIDKDICVGVFG